MQKIIYRLMLIVLSIISLKANAETLAQYVQECATQVGFDPNELPALNCNDGIKFADLNNIQTPVNDYLVHTSFAGSFNRIDVVAACRWLTGISQGRFAAAVSVEMLIHSKANGSTCFFAAKPQPTITAPDGTVFSGANEPLGGLVSTSIVSPQDPNASSYWMQPTDLNSAAFNIAPFSKTPLRCVGCHVAGPYIASPRIAPMLGIFGLLNDGHDTFATRYHAVGSFVSGSAFSSWDTIVSQNNSPGIPACNGCHSIGSNSTASTIYGTQLGFPVIPSLLSDIQSINAAGVMPADASPTSDYRWVNMSTPIPLDDNGEYEFLDNLHLKYPRFYCSNPSFVQAHVVGSNLIFNNHQLENLHYFNLQDGLVCLNAEQPNGEQCPDYQTRYLCDGTWTDWSNRDRPTASGDWEPRRGFPGLCASPTAIQARHDISITSTPVWAVVNGPNDRLAEFDTNGLACNNWEQSSGRCSDYVVRFICE